MFVFRIHYFIVGIALLLIEVLIALYIHDAFIRPYIGDFLVVILLYCLLRSFLKASVMRTIISVLLFAFAVELLQYFHFITLIGLQRSKLARVIMGTSFSWNDLIMYSSGALFVILVERLRVRLSAQKSVL
jgi:hypothetical protein